MTLVRFLSAAAAACLCARGAAQDLDDVTGRCDPSHAGCKADVAGDESELLQMKVKAHEVRNQSAYQYDESQAMALASLEKLSYCAALPGTPGSAEKTCGSKGYCEPGGVRIKNGSVHEFALADGPSMWALVAYVGWLESVPGSENPLKPGCVVPIRGTHPDTNNADRGREQEMVPFEFGDTCEDCLVHLGYLKIWRVLKPKILSTFETMGCSKTTPLYFTGHSMGGAESTIAMLDLKLAGWNVQHTYLFASPRTFNAAGVKYFNKVLTGSEDGTAVTRVTYGKDNIPTWPWDPQPDGTYYAYTWPEVHYDKEEGTDKYTYQVCMHESTDCGILSQKELCKMSECDDHCTLPITPGTNFCVFPDLIGTCLLGEGTVGTAEDLPEVARSHMPSEEQLNWTSQVLHSFL